MLQILPATRDIQTSWTNQLATALLSPFARRILSFKPVGSVLIELPTGRRLRFGEASKNLREPVLKLNNYRVIAKCLRRGTLGFAEAYIARDIECEDLTPLFQFFIRNQPEFAKSNRAFVRTHARDRTAHSQRKNCKKGSALNISDHYDLGNDFFAHWLDPQMVYSSALYERGNKTLEDAQCAKFDLITEFLQLDNAKNVLEIGFGWGGLARHITEHSNVELTGITLSHEQLAHARQALEQTNVKERCNFKLEDYRDVQGTFDRIVSIEMIEAVGEEFWPEFFSVLRDRLNHGGCAVIQAITIGEEHFDAYRQTPDFIQRYIFPGGMLPTKTAIEEQANAAGLVLESRYTFGKSYAMTLAEWSRRFEAKWEQISKLGYDQSFYRRWRYYLAYCEAGFLEDVIDVGAYRIRKA